jgi:hypothetical protein
MEDSCNTPAGTINDVNAYSNSPTGGLSRRTQFYSVCYLCNEINF